MKLPYLTVDVFTDRVLTGNPVAVVLDAAGLSSERMQAIASEFNYSETTFVLPPADTSHTSHVRIFTPAREVPFAGHPNLGTACALAWRAERRGEPVAEDVLFEEAAGLVRISLLREDGRVMGAELQAPERLSIGARVAPDKVAACLSLSPGDIATAVHAPTVVSVGLPFLVAELASRAALDRLAPNPTAYRELLPLDGAHAIYAYTRDVGADTACDLQARMFPLRLMEDPATGSATAATVAFLTSLLDGADGELSLRVRQGVAMGRPSLLTARCTKKDGVLAPARVGGRCVPAMEGSLRLA